MNMLHCVLHGCAAHTDNKYGMLITMCSQDAKMPLYSCMGLSHALYCKWHLFPVHALSDGPQHLYIHRRNEEILLHKHSKQATDSDIDQNTSHCQHEAVAGQLHVVVMWHGHILQ